MPQVQAASREIIDYKSPAADHPGDGETVLFSAYLSENFANPVFSSPVNYSAGEILVAVYAYARNIYFNFSGYTNLVTGLPCCLVSGYR